MTHNNITESPFSFEFDPRGPHRSPGSSSSRVIMSPNDRSFLVRMFPTQHKINDFPGELRPKNAKKALDIVNARKNHLAVLAESGIRIPYFSTLIAKPVRLGDRPSRVAIYDVVERIEMEKDADGYVVALDKKPAERQQLGNALLKYADWVKDTGQSIFLHDIFDDAANYGTDEDGRVVLYDIEPRFMPVAFNEQNGNGFENRVEEASWLLG